MVLFMRSWKSHITLLLLSDMKGGGIDNLDLILNFISLTIYFTGIFLAAYAGVILQSIKPKYQSDLPRKHF